MKAIIIFFSLFIFFSCAKEEYVPIDVSTTESLAMSAQWAVITNPYVSYMEESDSNAVIVSYGRIGDVIEVKGASIDNNNVLWYKFDGGWLAQDDVQIFANKLQADFTAQKVQ